MNIPHGSIDRVKTELQACAGVEALLVHLGENPTREGLHDTPHRVVKAYEELTSGMKQDPKTILGRVFSSTNDEMVTVRDIPFNSLCEHHMMPFWGTVTIGYLPANGKIVGLSKLPRLVHCYALRLQVQENMTEQIALAIQTYLKPLGVGVVVKGMHACMRFRGVHSTGEMITSKLLGVIKTKPEARAEFLQFVHNGDK